MTDNAVGLISIGGMILQFAHINRVTLHVDGVTPESDTDHTVMLSVAACAIASKLYPHVLDVGKVAQFAIVHDLVEVYAGDTNTFSMKHEEREEKEKREKDAFLRIQQEFEHVYPWIPSMIMKYESLDTKEARFVKTLDKAMTKVTNILNQGAYYKRHQNKKDEVESYYKKQIIHSRETYGAEFPELLLIIEELMGTLLSITYKADADITI